MLLSWGLWKRRFGGNPAILNRTIDIDAVPYTVIGVMPAWFDFPDLSTQLWTPVYHDEPEDTMTSFSNHMFSVVGRLKPGAKRAAVRRSEHHPSVSTMRTSTTRSYFEAR